MSRQKFVPKLILFDFGGVLGSDANEWRTTFAPLLERTGLSAEQLDELWRQDWPALKVGKGDLHAVMESIAALSEREITADELMGLYKEQISIDDEMLQMARHLAQRYDLAILANESRAGMEFKIEKFNLNSVFPHIFGSAHIGLAKPGAEAFMHVLERVHVHPEEVLFIDNQQNNIDAAQQLGMHAVLFQDARQLRRYLAEEDIL